MMPNKSMKSPKMMSKKIEKLMHEGYPHRKAIAIAMQKAGKSKRMK